MAYRKNSFASWATAGAEFCCHCGAPRTDSQMVWAGEVMGRRCGKWMCSNKVTTSDQPAGMSAVPTVKTIDSTQAKPPRAAIGFIY